MVGGAEAVGSRLGKGQLQIGKLGKEGAGAWNQRGMRGQQDGRDYVFSCWRAAVPRGSQLHREVTEALGSRGAG